MERPLVADPVLSEAAPGAEPVSDEGAGGLSRGAVVAGLAGAAGVAVLAGRALAGPLNPPAGPVSGTVKPIAEVEPRTAINATNTPGDATAVFIISQPGSYYLAGNLSVPANKTGIRVSASNVSIDLRGFVMSGNGAGSAGISDAAVARTDISVRDGVIRTMGGFGIFLNATERATVEDVRVHHCALEAIRVGASSRVIGCRADSNAASLSPNPVAIRAYDRSHVVRCVAMGNTGVGIWAGMASVVESCLAVQNTGNGVETLSSSRVLRCVSYGNGGAGILGAGAAVTCCSTDNGARGIGVSGGAVEGCAARANGAPNFSASAATISECTSSLSISAGNTAHGYDLGASCVLRDSTAYNNAGHGVNAAQNSRIDGCTVRRNTYLGISVAGSCHVVRNTCSDNVTGVSVLGSSSRVEGNLCTGGSNYGVLVSASYNLVVRNSCSLNVVNYSLYSNCPAGPVVDRTNPAVSGMSGNGTVASTMATTDAHANFAL